MSDGFTATVDDAALLSLLDRLGPSVDFVAREVGRDTARRIVAEAQRRAARLTGDTAGAVHFDVTYDGAGYVVLGYTDGVNDAPVDLFLEYGTDRMYARPVFFDAAELEQGPHLQRLIDKVQDWLDQVGR